MRIASRVALLGIVGAVSLFGCHREEQSNQGHVVLRADRSLSLPSAYPLAVDVARVGTYPAETKSGGGYFYDDVLEYRVWLHPDRGAQPLSGDQDYCVAFAQYEKAEAFSKSTKGAEEALVLVRQFEWIDEPEPGHYVPNKAVRITEWQVQWLAEHKRSPDSIGEFLKHPRPAKE